MRFRSSTHAMVWSILKRQQLSLFALIFSIPALVLIKLLLQQYLPADIYQRVLTSHPMLLVIISSFMIMMFTFAELNGSFSKNVFPRYTFTHPLTSTRLAIIPILLGIFISYLFYSAWFMFVAEYQFSFLQHVILLCCVSSAVSWLQVLSWRYNNAPYLSMTLMLTIAFVIFVLIVSSWGNNDWVPLVNSNLAYAGLIVLPISGIVLAINSVARCRTNETQNKTLYLSNVKFIGFGLPRRYLSNTHALFRYEWRVFGWIMPMTGIFMFTLLVFVGLKVDSFDKMMNVIFLMIATMIYLPWFLPAEMSKSELTSSGGTKTGLSTFLCNLPVTNFQIAMAKLRLAATSTLIYHAMLLVAVNYFVFSIENDAFYTSPWNFLVEKFGTLTTFAFVLALDLFIPVITWVLGGNTLAWCLKGNKFFNARRLVIIGFGLMFIIPLTIRLYTSESFRALLLSYASHLNWLILICIIAVFLRSLIKYKKTENLQKLEFVFIGSALLFAFFAATFFAMELPSINKLQSVLILVDLTLLGILPFLTSPLSVAVNRAR